jgi:hypothetical protein
MQYAQNKNLPERTISHNQLGSLSLAQGTQKVAEHYRSRGPFDDASHRTQEHSRITNNPPATHCKGAERDPTMARPSTATAASTISTTSVASTASTVSPSPTSLLWAHQLKREHTYLAERYRQIESKSDKLEEVLHRSEEGQKERIARLDARIDEITHANATALQACEAVRKEDNARTNELRDEIQLLKSTVEHHGRIQVEADVQRDKTLDGQLAILKRLAIFEQGVTGHANAVTKLSDELQKVCAKDTYMQEQIDLMNAMAGKDKDANQKEMQRTMQDLSEAIKTIQSLEARIEQLSQSVVLLAQENNVINTKLAQRPAATEIPAQVSTSSTLLSLDKTTAEKLDFPTSTTVVHDLPLVDEETVVSSSPVHELKASDRAEPNKIAVTSRKSQKTSRVVKVPAKRVVASRTRKAPTKKGERPQVADSALHTQAKENVEENASNNASETREQGEEVLLASQAVSHQPIAAKVKDKGKGALESQARPKKQKGKSAQASDRTAASASNTKRGVKRKAQNLPADQDGMSTKTKTTSKPQAEIHGARNQSDGKPDPPFKHDAILKQREDETRSPRIPAKAAPALRRSARTQQSQARPAPNRESKPSAAVTKPTAKKPVSGRDRATGKFIKRMPAKRLIRVSSEGSPTLIDELEQSVETSKPRGQTDDRLVRDNGKQPAAKKLAPTSPDSRPTLPAKRAAPQSRYIQRDFSLSNGSTSKNHAHAAKADHLKENVLPEYLIPSSPPPLQSRRNTSEASTLIHKNDSIDILVEDSLPKPAPPPPPVYDAPRAAKRRRIDTNLDDDIEELMRLKRELMQG